MRTIILIFLLSLAGAHACDFSGYNASCTDQLFANISSGNISDLQGVHKGYLNQSARLADSCNQGNCSGLSAIPEEQRSTFFNHSTLTQYNTSVIMRNRQHINARWPSFVDHYHNASGVAQREMRNNLAGFRGHPFDKQFFMALNSETAEENFWERYQFGDITRFFSDLSWDETMAAIQAYIEGPGSYKGLGEMDPERLEAALEESYAIEEVSIPTDTTITVQDGMMQLGNHTINLPTFTYGNISLRLHNNTLTVNGRHHLRVTRNLSATNQGLRADNISSGTSRISTNISGTRYSFNTSYTNATNAELKPQSLRFAHTDTTIRRTPGTDYFISNASELLLNSDKLAMRSADIVFFPDTLLAHCSNITFPFRFHDTLLNSTANLTTHEKLQGTAERMRISGTNNPGMRDSTLLINQSVNYANLTAADDATFRFNNHKLTLDEGEHAEYAHSNATTLRTNDSITAQIESYTLRTSTHPLATHHIDPVMVLTRMEGELALFNTTQYIESADTAELFSNASGAYVTLNNTYPLPPGFARDIYASGNITLSDIPGTVEMVDAAGTPTVRHARAQIATDRESVFRHDTGNITLANSRLTVQQDNYTEELYTPTNITATTDRGLRCMRLGPRSLYLYTPKHADSVGIQARARDYRLCLRKRPTENLTATEPFSGVFDILNRSLRLRDSVRLLRYPMNNGQQASLQLSPRHTGTTNNTLSANFSQGFGNTTELSTTGISTTWSGWRYFTISEQELNNSLHRLVRIDPTYQADSRLRTYQSPSAPGSQLHSRSLRQPRARVLPASNSEAQHILNLTAETGPD